MGTAANPTTPAPARPGWWLGLVAATQLCGSGMLATMFAIEDLDEGGVVVFWLLATVPVLVIGALAGVAAAVRAHRISSRVPSRLGWLANGTGLLALAHWLPMLLWSPAAFAFSLFGSRHTEDYLVSSIAGLLAWLIVGGTAVLLIRARGRLEAGPVRPYGRGPGLLAEWLVAAAYAVPVAFLAGAVIADGGDGRGFAWTALPALLGLATLVATPVAWAGAAADMTAARFGSTLGDWRWSFVGRLGALLALVATPLFAMTLVPAWDQGLGQRFGVQMVTIAMLGTATWLVARWRLPVGAATAPG